MCKDHCKNKLCVEWEAIAHHFLLTADEVQERVDTVGDSEEDKLSSVGDSEEGESSSVGDSEEETDPRVREEVGEIVKAFSTMAVDNEMYYCELDY